MFFKKEIKTRHIVSIIWIRWVSLLHWRYIEQHSFLLWVMCCVTFCLTRRQSWWVVKGWASPPSSSSSFICEADFCPIQRRKAFWLISSTIVKRKCEPQILTSLLEVMFLFSPGGWDAISSQGVTRHAASLSLTCLMSSPDWKTMEMNNIPLYWSNQKTQACLVKFNVMWYTLTSWMSFKLCWAAHPTDSRVSPANTCWVQTCSWWLRTCGFSWKTIYV